MAEGRSNFKGVTRRDEVKVDNRRVDTRRFGQKLADEANSPVGTLTIFIFLTLGCAVFAWMPFVPELILLGAFLFYRKHYNYKNKVWSAPARVPLYLNKLAGRDYLDEMSNAPGEGDIYMGFCLETNREVWAGLGDSRTHRIVIGTTGSGKTEELLAETCNALVHDSGVMMIDGQDMSSPLKLDTIRQGQFKGLLTRWQGRAARVVDQIQHPVTFWQAVTQGIQLMQTLQAGLKNAVATLFIDVFLEIAG